MDSDDENDAAHHWNRQLRVVNQVATAAALQMCSYFHIVIFVCHVVPLWTNRKERKRKRQSNVHRDRSSAIQFIHSWTGDMFKRQFRLFTTIWRRKATIQKNITTWPLEAVVHLLHWS